MALDSPLSDFESPASGVALDLRWQLQFLDPKFTHQTGETTMRTMQSWGGTMRWLSEKAFLPEIGMCQSTQLELLEEPWIPDTLKSWPNMSKPVAFSWKYPVSKSFITIPLTPPSSTNLGVWPVPPTPHSLSTSSLACWVCFPPMISVYTLQPCYCNPLDSQSQYQHEEVRLDQKWQWQVFVNVPRRILALKRQVCW